MRLQQAAPLCPLPAPCCMERESRLPCNLSACCTESEFMLHGLAGDQCCMASCHQALAATRSCTLNGGARACFPPKTVDDSAWVQSSSQVTTAAADRQQPVKSNALLAEQPKCCRCMSLFWLTDEVLGSTPCLEKKAAMQATCVNVGDKY